MRLELYINSELADINDESIMAITKTYESIDNPLNIYADYSKTVKLPISERNNAIFSNFNRQDSVVATNTVDYTKKFNFILLGDGDKLMEGTLQLNNANTIMKDEAYEVTLYSSFGTVMNTIGLLTFNPNAVDVDPQYIIASPFSDLTVNRQLVKESFEQQSHNINGNDVLDWIGFIPTYQGKYDEFSSDKEQVLSNGKTENLTQERDEHYTREFRSYYQQPFIWVDKLWKVVKDKIESITDYTFNLDKSWFTVNNPYYKDLIYTCPSLFGSDENFTETSVNFQQQLNFLTFNKTNKTPTLNTDFTKAMDEFTPLVPSDIYDSTSGIFNPDGDLGSTEFHGNFRFTMYAPFDTEIEDTQWGRITLYNPFYMTVEAVNANTNEAIYGASTTFQIHSNFSNYLLGDTVLDVSYTNIYRPNLTVSPVYRPVLYTESPSYGEPHYPSDGYYWETPFKVDLYIPENVPYKIKVTIHTLNNENPFQWHGGNSHPGWMDDWPNFFETTSSYDRGYSIYIDLLNGYAKSNDWHRSQSDLNLYRIFPKETTLRDVLLNYTKMCGLVWDVNEKEKTITVMSRNRFFTDYTIKDWSNKIDRSKEFKLQPLTFTDKYILFNYEEGDCGRLKSYESKYQSTYGAKKIDTGYDFGKEEKELFKNLVPSIVCQKKQFSCIMNTEYENQPNFMGYGYKVLPNEQYIDNDDEGSNAGMSGAFYFRNGTFAPDPQVSFTDSNGNYVVIVTDDTRYQINSNEYCWNSCGENVALCYALPDVSTISKEYNGQRYSVHFESPVEYYMPVDDNVNYLYNSYWKDYINERYCSQNKKLTAYIYITPNEFSNLDFREFIKIDNVLYHIDKIYDYNFNSDTPVKVDLVQVWNTSRYLNGQLTLTYLFTDPETVTVSSTDTTHWQSVDVYCSGNWSVVTSSVPSWLDAYKSGSNLMVKPKSTTTTTRTGYIRLNYVGTTWIVSVPIVQTPPPVCRLDVDRDTVVFGWESNSDTIVIDTTAASINDITVSRSANWFNATLSEYQGTVRLEGGSFFNLNITTTENTTRDPRNGTIMLSITCGGSTINTIIHIGQQSAYDYPFIIESSKELVTETHTVYDENDNPVSTLTVGNTYHFEDILSEQVDVNSITITNGTTGVSGNAGLQTIWFTPQLSDGETDGGGVILIDTVNGDTKIYSYNVTSSTPAPTSRKVIITTQNTGLFQIIRNNQKKIVDYYEDNINDGTQITLTAVDANGYSFTNWSVNNTTNTTKTYTFTVDSSMVGSDGNITINSVFKKQTNATVTIIANVNGYITVGSDLTHYTKYEATVPVGTTITNITAVANTNYQFAKWSDGSVKDNRDYTVTGDAVITASFEYIGADNYFYVEDISGSANRLSIVQFSGHDAPAIEVFYSTDQTNWSSMGTTSTTPIDTVIPANGKLYLKATTNSWSGRGNDRNYMYCSGSYNIGGNIMSLLYDDNFDNKTFTNSNDGAFYCLFAGDTNLFNSKALILPTNTIDNCYNQMFYGCTSLESTPELPAIVMTGFCYSSMFRGCTGLTTAPALPATTLAQYCYQGMFYNCTKLVTAPELPAKEIEVGCYNAMFNGCTSLTTAPVLPATKLVTNCYRNMFGGCTKLITVTTYAEDVYATDCLSGWLNNVATIGDFWCSAYAKYNKGASGIPEKWIVYYL